MAQNGPTGEEAKRHVQRVVVKSRPWIEYLARFGHAAYGTVYLLVGGLALVAALSGGGKTTGQEGALQTILLAPLGRILLGIVVLGLLAYAVWRVFQGVRDPDNEGTDAKGIAKRCNHVLNGLFIAALAFAAGQIALGSGGGGGGSPDDWTATLLQQPFGRWLTIAVGVVIVGVGLYQFWQAYRAKFMSELKPGEMSGRERRWTRRVGRLGYCARGVVFFIIGIFLAQAAIQTDPSQATGLGGALQTLARQPFGPYVLGATAFGLVAYGAFMFVVARYRRIDPA